MASIGTRERILDAAETLFASHGFAATALRSVIAEAGVNLAAVHYHFGSKEALIRSVFARRFGPLNAERLQRLDELERRMAGRPPEIEALLETFIRPALALTHDDADGRPLLLLLVGRLHTEPGSNLRALIFDVFEEVSIRYVGALTRALPSLSRAELLTRFHFVVGTMASCFVDPQALEFLSKGTVDPRAMDEVIPRMITFLAAGMRAPATSLRAANVGGASMPGSACAATRKT